MSPTMAVIVVAVTVVAATVVMVALLPGLRRIAIDLPNHRSAHTTPVPRAGGVPLIIGVFAGCAVAGAVGDIVDPMLLGGVATLALLGLADDLRNLGVVVRLALTVATCAGVAVALVQPSELRSVATVVAATVFMAGYTNAFNFMDGINGISALNAALAGGWLAFLASRLDEGGAVAFGLAIAAASLAFLPWNAPRATVFLGDSGSYGLGLSIAGLAVFTWASGAPLALTLAPLWIYVVDTASTLGLRIARGQGWSEAHRDHVYQRLVDGGAAHLASAGSVVAFGATACAIAWSTRSLSAWATVACGLVLAAAYLGLPVLRARVAKGTTTHAT